MLKKKLIKVNEELFERLNDANSTISEQCKTIEGLKEQILHLENKISTLEQALVVPEEETEENEEQMPCEGLFEEEKIPAIKEESINITDYASSIIGKIVIEATKSSNKITNDGATEQNKELINLILGRTEVAKSEILNIVLSDKSDSEKKISIDSVLTDSCEYFKSVLLQYS